VEATVRFAELMAAPEATVAPDEVALAIAAHGQPGADPAEARAALDRLADGCPEPTLDGVRAYLFRDLHYRGNADDYYDPRNSYLDEVVRRRLGIPITLAVLTVGVGRRLGVPLDVIGMPGHVLVGDRVDRDVFVDPFHAGALLDGTGCERLFHVLQGPDAPFHPSYLQPIGSHAVAARMLANLRAIFRARRDHRSLVWVLRLRTMVPGVPADERADLAASLAATGDFAAAADALEELVGRTDGEVAAGFARRAALMRGRLN
jgi:regulator of sirC expression with transglutaminase-like and TPR domain